MTATKSQAANRLNCLEKIDGLRIRQYAELYRKALMLRTVILTVFAWLLGCAAIAARADDPIPLFQDDLLLEVEIEGPFRMLAAERPEEEELPGELRYTTADGSVVELDVALRTRGQLRQEERICKFPPLRLNFRKSQVAGTLFELQDKLKLVTHCQNSSKHYEQAVVSEYLAYRIFNLLTDRSYRARLLNVRYIYTDDDDRLQKYAILIEDADQLAERLGAETAAAHGMSVRQIHPEDLNLTSVFQYMIGNTDFSPIASDPTGTCCHNQTLLVREGQLHYTVPYDFDLSGLVDAPHGFANPRFKLRSPRQRLYRGRCVNNDYLPATLELFRQRRDDIENLIQNQAELDQGHRKSMLSFISDFYETIDNPKKVRNRLIEKCV